MASMAPVTAVIGAGPAGLLFSLTARLKWMQAGGEADGWPILLFDKRAAYVRTHRLRIDPTPLRAIAADLAGSPFDEFIEFLESTAFTPEVNRLETVLLGLVEQVGIERERLGIGREPGMYDVEELRELLETQGRLNPSAPLTVVGADSVRSAIRSLVAGEVDGGRVYEVVCRLRIGGPGLPDALGRVQQFRLAKVLGSVLDYRLNSNGHAEVDLFLEPAEHEFVETLGAAPATPVPLPTPGPAAAPSLEAAPLFSAIVERFAAGFGAGRCEVSLQSTFRLEHRSSERVVFPLAEAHTTVLLVGDAALSLPFFRGMASLAACVGSLAAVHVEWATRVRAGSAVADETLLAYQAAVATIRQRELTIVRRRARLVALAREVVRISSRVPFPIQDWVLSESRPERGGGVMTPGVALNLVLAVVAGLVAVGAPVAGALVAPPLGWWWLLAVPIQAAGGAAFEVARAFESPENRLLGRIWRLQIASLLLLGVPVTLMASWLLGRPAQVFGLVGWFLLGLAFVGGLLVVERLLGASGAESGA